METFLSRKEVAARFGVSDQTIDRLCAGGHLERVRVGPRRVGITAESVRAFINRRVARCPRCGDFIPSAEDAGRYPGATSRADNQTEVCSACGVWEAFAGIRDTRNLKPEVKR